MATFCTKYCDLPFFEAEPSANVQKKGLKSCLLASKLSNLRLGMQRLYVGYPLLDYQKWTDKQYFQARAVQIDQCFTT